MDVLVKTVSILYSLSLLTGMNVLVIHIQLTLCVMATVVTAAPCYTFFS